MKYAALLRGISPTNPDMRNENLRRLFEKLEFTNVQTVISSGNVIFEAKSKDIKKLESMIEKAVPKLGFKSITVIQSKEQLQKLIGKNPFKKLKDAPKSKLNVTFLKSEPRIKLKTPFKVKNRDYKILGIYDRAICSTIDITSTKTPDLMPWLEKKFGKEITTRTWKTVNRIYEKMI